MWFCKSKPPLTRFILVTLVLLTVWISFSLVLMPSKQARAAERSSAPAVLGDPGELETFLNSEMAKQMADNHIPGATISIVKDGHVLLSKGYGDADIEKGKKASADSTLFRLGSLSKLFTWTAVMQLVEEGKVDLHADINKYLKTFRIPATYPQPITVENLLTHTAGFEEGTLGQLVPQTSDLTPLGTWLPKHIPARIFPPGTVTAYSNYGATLAGYIVEQVSGIPFEQYMEQHIFQPLGMNRSSFRQPLPTELSDQMSQGYTYSDKSYHTNPFEVIETVPAGAISSTASDMARFMIAQLQMGRFGNSRILQEATAREMQHQHFANDSKLPGMAYGFYEQKINKQHLIGHSGDTGLFYSQLMLLPQQNVGIFVTFNNHGGSNASSKLLEAFMDHYYSVPPVDQTLTLAGSTERISQIEGSYWSTRRNKTTYQKVGYSLLSPPITVSASNNGHLVIKGIGNQERYLVEIEPWVFKQTNGLDDTVTFRNNGSEMNMFIGNRPYQAYQKIAWYETSSFHLGLFLICLLLFLGMGIFWPLRLVRNLRRKRSSNPKVRNIRSELPQWLGWIMSTLHIIVLVGLVLHFISSNPFAVQFATSPTFVVVTVLASISVLITIGVVICSVLIWRVHTMKGWHRFSYALLALAGVAFSVELIFWNLIWLP
jgi:CubicO group peptidase (beta-lactamase class C family)